MREGSSRCIEALLNSAADPSEGVRDNVVRAVTALSAKDPLAVLDRCQQWLASRKPSSTSELHRYVVVTAIIAVLLETVNVVEIPPTLRAALIKLSIAEMTATTDLQSDWAKEACRLCVEMLALFPKEGCEALIEPMNSQSLPHFYVIDALAKFADEQPLRFVPYLKEAIAKILPIMSLAKQDNHRMFLAKAIGTFADAILQIESKNAVLTPRSAQSANYSRGDFADTMYSGIQFLTGDWSRVSELRVRVQVTFAMGTMFAICSDENRTALIPKVLSHISAALKKEKPRDMAPVARGVAAMLMHCSETVAYSLRPHMDAFMTLMLQSLVNTMHDKELNTNPAVKSTLNYLLMATEQVATFHMEELIMFVGKILDAKSNIKDPAMRAACLQVFRHLISRKALEPRLQPYTDNIIATLKLSMNDADLRVRKTLVSAIVAMGASEITFFRAIGGTDLLAYVIRNAAIGDQAVADHGKKENGPVNSLEDLRDTCRNTLALFSGSQGKLDKSLWPYMFEHLGEWPESPSLINAFPTACRCITQLGNRVGETDFYYVDFNVKVNVPKPAALAAKFLVGAMTCEPLTTAAVLDAMMAVGPLLDEPFLYQAEEEIPTPIGSLWLGTVPELQKLLAADATNAEAWEDYVSRLASKTMTAKGSETWPEEVTAAALADLRAFLPFPALFRSCLIIIGIGISKCNKKDFVAKTIDAIVDIANHDHPDHRVGLGKAFGYVSALHPDIVVEKLSLLAKGPEKKSLFGGSKDKDRKELTEGSRSVAVLGLCYAARRMPQTVLPSRLDASIVPIVCSVLTEAKVSDVREVALDAIPLLEVPVRKLTGYTFRGRDSMIETIMRVVPVDPASKSPSSQGLLKHVLLAFKAIAALTRSCDQPTVATAVQDKITAFVQHYVQRPWQDLPPAQDTEATMVAVELLNVILRHNGKMPLDEATAPFLALTVSQKEHERHRATLIAGHMVRCAHERTAELLAASQPSACTATVGTILGRFLPRFMDVTSEIRSAAAEGIRSTVLLTSLLHPSMLDEAGTVLDDVLAEIDGLRERARILVADGTASAEKEANSITKGLCSIVVGVMVSEQHFTPLIDTLLNAGLTDPQDAAASCSCVVMHGMVRGLGQKLPEPTARKYLDQLVDAVQKVGHREQSLNGILVSIRNLAKHHTLLSFNGLLKYPTPHAENVIKAVHAVASDSGLSSALLQHCLDTVLNSQLHEDIIDKDKKSRRVLAATPCAAACMVGWICQVSKGAEAATELRGAVFCTLSLYLSAAHEMGDAGKVKIVSLAIRHFLECTSQDITIDRTERIGWGKFEHPKDFFVALTEITKYLCREELGDTNDQDRKYGKTDTGGLDVPASEPTALAIEIAQFILPYMNKPVRSHRRAAIACTTALLRHSIGEPRLLLSIVTALQGRCGSDEHPVLRADSLLAFQHLTVHPYEAIVASVSPVLGALLSNFADTEMTVAEAATTTAHHMLTTLPDKSQIAPNVVNIVLKTKALFEHSHVPLRRESYRIFGYVVDMTIAGHIDRITMSEQIHLHLATILTHVEDDVAEVREAAKGAFFQCLTFIGTEATSAGGREAVAALCERPFMQPTHKNALEDLMNELTALWVTHFPGRVNDLMVSTVQFFGRDRDCLRMPAVAACGFFLRHLAPEDMTRANVDQVANALIAHLNPSRERNPAIRARAAKALGMMCSL